MHNNNSAIHIGIYYGKQEQAPEEQIKEEFSKLTTQVKRLKQNGEVVLTGDFDAKLEVNKDQSKQKQSRNGKIMAGFLQKTTTNVTRSKHRLMDRSKQEQPYGKICNWLYISYPTSSQTKQNIIIDETGNLRMKGRKESDLNTITMETKCQTRKSQEKRRIWRTNNEEA